VEVTVRACRSLAEVESVGNTVPMGDFHRACFERQDGSVYLLAWAGDVAVGHVLVTPESKYPEVHAELGRFPEANALGVMEGLHRHGIGRALMAAALAEGARMGDHRFGLAVEADNLAAIGLYETLGFSRRPGMDIVDVWHWTDEAGAEHEQRDPCTYWTRYVQARLTACGLRG
jgi:GNAT superfamily N-acetyltransferase